MATRFSSSAGDIAAIQACFGGYRDALLQQKGAAVVRLVTRETLDRYEFYRLGALHAPVPFLELLGAMDCMSILRFRHSIPVDLLHAKPGADLFAYSVDNGWVGKESVANNTLGELVVFENWAETAYLNGGQVSPIRARFVREADGWKFDLMHTMYQSAPGFESAIRSDDKTKCESILQLLSRVLNQELDARLFEPLVSD